MGTYKHRFKLAYFYRVNIFHLVLSGYANQPHNFTNLVFFFLFTDDVITSLLYRNTTIQRCIGEAPYFFPYKNFDYWKRYRDTTTKQNRTLLTSMWNYSLLYSHFAWDKDSERTHAQLHGLVCTQGSATCIASWALYRVQRKSFLQLAIRASWS